MARKLHIVWNEARNEGVVFADDPEGEGLADAMATAQREFSGFYTSLGAAFAQDCYDDDELTLETVVVAETEEG